MDNIKTYTIDSEVEELSPEMIEEYIKEHRQACRVYEELGRMYQGDYPILHQRPKPNNKPDHRLVANYAKYIVDTFNGYFVGIPIKTNADNETANEYIQDLEKRNSIDDRVSELSKKCDIYGHAFELLYMDENAEVCIADIEPEECILIRDNSIRNRKKFCIRYYQDEDRNLKGTVSDDQTIKYFEETDNGLVVTDEIAHPFGEVPVIEYMENSERQGAFENVTALINAYNKAISEKTNDVDYFSDAYLKILGGDLSDKTLKHMRDNRIINVPSKNGEDVVVDFVGKPNADESQEHLLDRLERLIFSLSMVANINDEKFGTASGIALQYKLQSMSNLAQVKERKFQKGFDERYRMIARVPTSGIREEDLVGIDYVFSRNVPRNVKDEAEIARTLQGMVSDETLLGVLSIVPDAQAEIEKLKEEEANYPSIDMGGVDHGHSNVEAEDN